MCYIFKKTKNKLEIKTGSAYRAGSIKISKHWVFDFEPSIHWSTINLVENLKTRNSQRKIPEEPA
jgi:hypothetical protein